MAPSVRLIVVVIVINQFKQSELRRSNCAAERRPKTLRHPPPPPPSVRPFCSLSLHRLVLLIILYLLLFYVPTLHTCPFLSLLLLIRLPLPTPLLLSSICQTLLQSTALRATSIDDVAKNSSSTPSTSPPSLGARRLLCIRPISRRRPIHAHMQVHVVNARLTRRPCRPVSTQCIM